MEFKYFKLDEFDCPSMPGSGEKYMCKDFVKTLNSIRHTCGIPLVISSGYRTKEHNDSLKNASKNSSHLIGVAADILCDNSADRIKIVAAAIQHKVRRIGIAEGFIHLDVDFEKPNAIWLY
jgi:zinc D-Ala-D-Ala carboxypeptidase